MRDAIGIWRSEEWLGGLLPRQAPREPPAPGQKGVLSSDTATYFTSVEPDDERSCRGYLHTWQRVLFDPQNRDQARFAFGYRSPLEVLFERAILVALAAAIYGGFRLFKKWRQRRAQ
jgi:hypothetical protein